MGKTFFDNFNLVIFSLDIQSSVYKYFYYYQKDQNQKEKKRQNFVNNLFIMQYKSKVVHHHKLFSNFKRKCSCKIAALSLLFCYYCMIPKLFFKYHYIFLPSCIFTFSGRLSIIMYHHKSLKLHICHLLLL